VQMAAWVLAQEDAASAAANDLHVVRC